MLSSAVGLAVTILSLWGMFRWWPDVLLVLRGFLPLCFFFGGMIALLVGLSTFKAPAEPTKK